MYQAVHTEMETISRKNWSPRLRQRRGPDHHHGAQAAGRVVPVEASRRMVVSGRWC
jgi:hypothetical protein